MAKEKKEKKSDEAQSTGDALKEVQKLIAKKYGAVAFDGSYIKDNPRERIPTTPTMDLEIGGGVPEGVYIQLSGKPKTGKTSLALQIAANGQKQGRHVHYLDAEHRFDEKNLETIHGLETTPDKFTIYQSTKENRLTAEKYLDIAETIINGHERSVVIIDSISLLCSTGEMAKEIGEAARPDGPKMFGQFCRRNASSVPLNKICLIGISHLIANTSGFGSPNMEDGGNKIQFADAGLFRIKTTWNWEEGSGENKKKIGQQVDWQIVYNPAGPPGAVVKTFLRYGWGYDQVWEITTLAIDLGLILKSGAWFLLPEKNEAGEEIKVNGQSKVHEYYMNHMDKCLALYEQIKEMVA